MMDQNLHSILIYLERIWFNKAVLTANLVGVGFYCLIILFILFSPFQVCIISGLEFKVRAMFISKFFHWLLLLQVGHTFSSHLTYEFVVYIWDSPHCPHFY